MGQPFRDIRSVLVVKLRHIGDVLLTVPAVRAVKETFPGARVTALVNSGTEDMLTLNPLLSEVMAYDRSIKSLSFGGRALGELAFLRGLRKRSFDLSIDLTGGDRPALLGLLSGARYRLGYEPRGGFAGKRYLYTHTGKRPAERTHTVLRDLGLLRQFGIDTKDLRVDMYASPADDDFVEAALREKGVSAPFVHVHPTSRWLFKCWTDSGMAEVIDRFLSRGLGVVVTSGPAEAELRRVSSILALAKGRPVDLSGRISLKHLSALSRRSALFFGVDTAPMHIAAASGAPVAAVFGPSGAFDWGPWDNAAPHRYPLEGAFTPYPGRNGVQRSGRCLVIQKGWECAPCGSDGCEGTKRSRCLDELTADEVWRELEGLLASLAL